jgi:hypothetical protein
MSLLNLDAAPVRAARKPASFPEACVTPQGSISSHDIERYWFHADRGFNLLGGEPVHGLDRDAHLVLTTAITVPTRKRVR